MCIRRRTTTRCSTTCFAYEVPPSDRHGKIECSGSGGVLPVILSFVAPVERFISSRWMPLGARGTRPATR